MAEGHQHCYGKHPVSGKTVLISLGEDDYYEAKNGYENLDPDRLNKSIGVSKEEAEAMLLGSMFGWNCPAAREVLTYRK